MPLSFILAGYGFGLDEELVWAELCGEVAGPFESEASMGSIGLGSIELVQSDDAEESDAFEGTDANTDAKGTESPQDAVSLNCLIPSIVRPTHKIPPP